MEKNKDLIKAETKIGDMTCAMCVGAVEKALQQLPGVESVMVNLGSEQAYVNYDQTTIEPLAANPHSFGRPGGKLVCGISSKCSGVRT